MSQIILSMFFVAMIASATAQSLQIDDQAYAEKYARLYKLDSARGNYLSAIRNHILYQRHFDSAANIDQRKRIEALMIVYASEKKDQDIRFLTQKEVLRKAELKQKENRRNMLIGSIGCLLLIGGLLFGRFKLKQKTNEAARRKNLELQYVISEKEWLVKEVHHRVKNNLQTVICLLESQARHLKEDAFKAIEISRDRIYTISLVHQLLYQSEDSSTIDMSVFVPEFLRHLDSRPDVKGRIHFHLDVPPLNLAVGQAVPLALIINEVVTNSIKYAFPGKQSGTIDIGLQRAGEKVTLRVADDGIGIDPALRTSLPHSPGLKLVKNLCEEMHGTLHIDNSAGLAVHVVLRTDLPLDGESITKTAKHQEAYT